MSIEDEQIVDTSFVSSFEDLPDTEEDIVEVPVAIAEIRDKCGLVGVYEPDSQHVVYKIYRGLGEVQNRGRDAAGMVVARPNQHDDGELELVGEVGRGKVEVVFKDLEGIIGKLGENALMGIGHVRNRTSDYGGGHPIERRRFSIAHNGNVSRIHGKDIDPNYGDSSSIADYIQHVVDDAEGDDFVEPFMEAVQQIEGAFNLLVLTKDELIAVRDPHGFKPLHLGRTETGGYVIDSETKGFKAIGATHEREVAPGEVIVIGRESGTLKNYFPFANKEIELKKCLLELDYLESPLSRELNHQGEYEAVGEKRFRIGQTMGELEKQLNPDFEADIVISVPETGRDPADGYGFSTGIRVVNGFIKNPNSDRTFIAEPDAYRHQTADLNGGDLEDTRRLGVREKLDVQQFHVEGKRVVVVDDSIVRGTTTGEIVQMLYEAGATEVHLRITAPPYKWPCLTGIDTGTPDVLLAYLHDGDIDGMRDHLKCTSLAFVGVEKMIQAVSNASEQELKQALGRYCTACFTGDYPSNSGVTPELLRKLFGDNPMPMSSPSNTQFMLSH